MGVWGGGVDSQQIAKWICTSPFIRSPSADHLQKGVGRSTWHNLVWGEVWGVCGRGKVGVWGCGTGGGGDSQQIAKWICPSSFIRSPAADHLQKGVGRSTWHNLVWSGVWGVGGGGGVGVWGGGGDSQQIAKWICPGPFIRSPAADHLQKGLGRST